MVVSQLAHCLQQVHLAWSHLGFEQLHFRPTSWMTAFDAECSLSPKHTAHVRSGAHVLRTEEARKIKTHIRGRQA